LGYTEFSELGRKIIPLAQENSNLLLQVSVYLKNYARLNQAFMGLNNFFRRESYSPAEMRRNPIGQNFFSEA